VSWLSRYHDNLITDMKQKAPFFIGADKFQTLWPLLLGGAIFAFFDLTVGLSGATRSVLFVVCVSPGVAWALYIIVLGFRFVVSAWKQRKSDVDQDGLNG
jgi:hypothetical protein